MRSNGHYNGNGNGNGNGHAKAAGVAALVDAPQASRPAQPAYYDEPASFALRHFRLTSHPFADNVNPEFFFRTEAHEEAFGRMRQCIEEQAALGLTAAPSGTGKTLLTQILMQTLDPRRHKAILILAYPGMTKTALLREILTELEIDPGRGARMSAHVMMRTVQDQIIRLHHQGVRLVVIIDEVHFLRTDSLHILRTLSNIETPERKLVTVLLFGEESFMQRIEQDAYRSLFSRIFGRVSLRPLNRGEVEQYIKFRCLMAGGGPSLFAPEVFDNVYETTGGIPREINRLCHNALDCAARKGLIRVDLSAM